MVGAYRSKTWPVAGCPQPDPPMGHFVQYPLTRLCYYGPRSRATGAVDRDACGAYWCDGERFVSLRAALDHAEETHVDTMTVVA